MLLKKSAMVALGFLLEPLMVSFDLGRLPISGELYPRPTSDATALTQPDAYATHKARAFGGGHQKWFASVLRFCTIAARWNSSRAPKRPLNRMRSKR
jgi:hypothetical protein